MVPAGAARRGRPHRPSPAGRGVVAARAPWRGPGRGGRGPGAVVGSSAAPSRALGAGSAAQSSGGGWRSREGGRPVAAGGGGGGGDGGGGGGPGPGWRAGGSCDPDTRSPPGRGAGAGRRGGGARPPAGPASSTHPLPPPAAAGERGRTAQGAGLPGRRSHYPEGGALPLGEAGAGGAGPEGESRTLALRITLLRAFWEAGSPGKEARRERTAGPIQVSPSGAGARGHDLGDLSWLRWWRLLLPLLLSLLLKAGSVGAGGEGT